MMFVEVYILQIEDALEVVVSNEAYLKHTTAHNYRRKTTIINKGMNVLPPLR